MYLTAPIFHLTWPELSSYEIFLSQKKKKKKGKVWMGYIYIYNITFLTIFSIKLHFTPLIILLIFLETKKNSSIDKIKPKLHPKQTP